MKTFGTGRADIHSFLVINKEESKAITQKWFYKRVRKNSS